MTVAWITEAPADCNWIERVLGFIELADDGCWVYTGALDRSGYGSFKVTTPEGKRQTGAHRAMWLATRSPIPFPMMLDHLCRNRACVNPDHLEIVTNRENSARSVRIGRPRGSGRGCGKHGWSDGYVKEMKNGYVRWVCRTCARSNLDRFKARAA